MNEAAKQLLLSLLGEFEAYIDEQPDILSQLDVDIMDKMMKIPAGYEDMLGVDISDI